MRRHKPIVVAICSLAVLLLPSAVPAGATERGPLRAGAARVDVTPTTLAGLTNLWGTPFEGVHDKIYVRALVLDNSRTTAALVAGDVVEFGDTTAVRQRIANETGIPADNILISATHDHNAPRVGAVSPGASARAGGPATAAYTEFVYERLLEAVRQAKARLAPARVGAGAGHADVNTNRNELTPKGWKLGVNPDLPSDKTVWVVKFENTAGDPIAYFVNYAVHAVVMGPENKLVTGDIAGATSRYIEQHFDDKVVALWTSGPAGDQNPKFMAWDTTFTNKTLRPGFGLMESQAQILAEEAIRTASGVDHTLSDIRLMGAQRMLTCPANLDPRRPAPIAGPPSSEVNIRLGLVMIDRIALAAVSAEVYTNIYWHLKKESPFTNTIMVTLVNDRLGYLPDDAAYEMPYFGVPGPAQKNCAEPGIVNGILEMMDRF
jgi:hypothetical protein